MIVILGAALLAGCAASAGARSSAPLSNVAATRQPPAGGSDDDAVRLAVFRYLLGHNASGGQSNVPFVCLEVYEDGQDRRARDPSPFIMEGMRELAPPVMPISACEADPGTGVFLKGDHARGRGLIFRTGKVTIEGDKATVSGGYYEGGLSASGNVYTVERHGDGGWEVTHDEMQWISGLGDSRGGICSLPSRAIRRSADVLSATLAMRRRRVVRRARVVVGRSRG